MSETTTVETSVLSYFGLEIGLFTIATMLSSFFVLRRIKGNIFGLEYFFAEKKWPFLSSDKAFIRSTLLLKIITGFLMLMPVISLILWGIMVLVVQNRYNMSKVAGTSIFLVGFSIIFFALAVLYVKWSYFKIKIVSILSLATACILYFAFQLYAILETTVPSFLGLSAVFLSINAIIMVLTVSMAYSESTGSILDIFDKLVANTNKEEAIDTKYNKLTVEEQYEKLLADPDYEITEKEIMKYVTIISSRKDFSNSVLSGGVNTIFRKRSLIFKRITLSLLYLLSVGILVIYAVIVNNRLPEKQLGYVTLIAVITTDVITFFASQLDISRGQTTLTILIVGMRCFLFGFGGTYWFLGYCSLYLLLGLVIGWKTVERYLPLEIDYSKPKDTAPLYKRIIKEPLFTYGIINIVFIIVVAIVGSVDSLDIPRGVFSVLGQYYALWVFGVACILISLTVFAIMMTFRLHQRRLKCIKDKFKFPFIKREFSTYLVFSYFTYLFAALCGILWYVIVKDIFVLLTALIVPPVLLASYLFYLNFKKNDYKFLADIKDQNIKAKAFLEAQAKAKQLKTLQTNKTTGKEDLEAVQLQEEEGPKDDGVPEFLNFSGSASQKKFVIHEDWRESMNFFKAFFKRKLLYSDYANIFSILFILAALITYAVVVYSASDSMKLRGFTVAVTLFVLTTILLPMEGYFGTLQTPNFIQIFFLALGTLGNYGYAIAVTLSQHSTIKGDTSAIVTVIYWFIFLPSAIMTGIALYSLKQQKWKKSLLTIILAAICFVHWIMLGVIFILVDSLAAGLATWGLLILLAGALSVYYIYRKNNNSLPRRVVQIASYGGTLLLCVVFIVSLCLGTFNDFVGFSITYLGILFCFVLYVVKQIVADIANKDTEPVFYSPWVFPIYKYDPNINALKKNSLQGYMTFGVIFFFWAWTITVSIWVDPVSLGISLGCLCEVAAAVYFVYMTTDSSTLLSEALKRNDLFPKVVKKAWLQARNTYLTSKNVTKASDVLTFSEYQTEIQKLLTFIDQTKTHLKNQSNKQQVAQSDPESGKKKESTELKQMYEKLAEKVKAKTGAFKDEIRLLIHFELLVVLSIGQAVSKEKMTILTFINQKKVELDAHGLKFVFAPENLTIDAKYKLVMDKYNRLSESDQKKFDSLKADYLEQVKHEKIDASEKMKAEEEAKKQREKALSEKLNKQKQLMQDMSSIPLKDMPDCVQKYERIIKEYGPSKKKYEDTGFPANTNSLGGEMVANFVDTWGRPDGLSILGTGAAPTDPRQGAIGDCYFISALSVAGKENIEKALLSDKIQQKPEIGAYIVRFYFMGEPVEVIVDDLFPKDGQGEWSFCRADNGDKLWPMIFEKAYAKLHGSYQKIVAGKVSYALSELTGGYPEEIKLSTAQKNIDTFWQKIMKYKENGYLLGAGTPENPMGDAAISSEGIIQGHAYGIIDLKEYEDDKLIKLRNPHGIGGAEWRGDWSDASIKWTDKAKKMLKPENAEDGIFWMSLQDFVYEFKCLYVCRIFDQKLWKTVPTIQGQWAGETAAGLPNKKNPSADLSKNPHYGIKVNRRCSVFIALTQNDRIDMFRGKLPIMFMVQKNGGKRVTSASTDLLAGTSGAPTDLITVSTEVMLDVPTYPYTFSLMVANANSGAEGEGTYKLDIQCTDDFSIVELK